MASDKVIINAGVNHWYGEGARRLRKSLKKNYDGKVMQWIDRWPNNNYDGRSVYCIKAAAMEEAMQSDYRYMLWLDCSIWATKDVTPVFEHIAKYGYYAVDNGYNLAQTVSDRCLEYFNISRDEAELLPESASGIMGIDLKNNALLAKMFIVACREGAADGSRHHDNQSSDPRFLFHRQDQSVWSCCLYKMNMKPNDTFGDIISYRIDKKDKDPIFLINGMG